jgi:hypothetical protein
MSPFSQLVHIHLFAIIFSLPPFLVQSECLLRYRSLLLYRLIRLPPIPVENVGNGRLVSKLICLPYFFWTKYRACFLVKSA